MSEPQEHTTLGDTGDESTNTENRRLHLTQFTQREDSSTDSVSSNKKVPTLTESGARSLSNDDLIPSAHSFDDLTSSGQVRRRVPRAETPLRSDEQMFFRNDLESGRVWDSRDMRYPLHSDSDPGLSADHPDIRIRQRLEKTCGDSRWPGDHRFPTALSGAEFANQHPWYLPVAGQPVNSPSNLGTNHRKYRKPAVFDKTTKVQEYLVHFEIMVRFNRWDGETQALELAMSLRGNALCVLSEMTPRARKNYDELVAALKARFEPDNLVEMHCTNLRSRIRQQGETIEEMAQKIKKVVRKAYPNSGVDIRKPSTRGCRLDEGSAGASVISGTERLWKPKRRRLRKRN